MKNLMLAALALLPLAAGCYVAPYPHAYYARPSYVRVYGPRPVVVRPARYYW